MYTLVKFANEYEKVAEQRHAENSSTGYMASWSETYTSQLLQVSIAWQAMLINMHK
jgi:hypothetical protein